MRHFFNMSSGSILCVIVNSSVLQDRPLKWFMGFLFGCNEERNVIDYITDDDSILCLMY